MQSNDQLHKNLVFCIVSFNSQNITARLSHHFFVVAFWGQGKCQFWGLANGVKTGFNIAVRTALYNGLLL